MGHVAMAYSSPRIPRAWQRYIEKAARKYAFALFDTETAEQTAALAYYKAVKQHHPAAGPFIFYATAAIRNALLDARKAEQRHWFGRAEPEESGTPPVLPNHNAEEEDRLEAIEVKDDAAALAAWKTSLPSKLAEICQGLYYEDLSQRALAKRYGLTQARISQINRQLLTRARSDLVHLRRH
jgi:RNA polymerase sigma factor (sigma-70 family)